MSTEANKSLVRRFYAELDTQQRDTALELLAPDYVAHVPGAPGPLDRHTFQGFGAMFYAAFPDGRHVFDEVLAEGDTVVTRGVFSGTHRGELQGIPPTGKQVSMATTMIDHVRDGKIVEHWGQADFLGLMQQLGAIPVTA
jgi:predicted ester cyclase